MRSREEGLKMELEKENKDYMSNRFPESARIENNIKWTIECRPFGFSNPPDLVISIEKAPNWFHRKMMTLCFGFKWEWLK